MIKQVIKKVLFGSSVKIRTIKFGIASGISMKVNPMEKIQRILGLDEFEIHAHFKSFAKQYDTFVDIGSSDGFYSLIYRKYNPGGKIFSCEGESSFKEEQMQNFEANNFLIEGTTYRFITGFIGSQDTVNTTCINSLMKDHSGAKILFKIDIEGAEVDALKGGYNVLKKHKCALIIETHSLQLEKECTAFLTDLDYKCEIINNSPIRKLIPEKREISHNRWLIAVN